VPATQQMWESRL